MDLMLSPTVSMLLFPSGDVDFSKQVEVPNFITVISERSHIDKNIVQTLFAELCGAYKVSAVLQDLEDLLPFDSTVRDMATIGHLGKLFSRRPIYETTKDWRIVGLPHSLFDSISWKERNEVFKEGVTHAFNSGLLEIPAVKEMLDREAAKIKARSA